MPRVTAATTPGPRISANAHVVGTGSLAALFVPLVGRQAGGAYCPGTGAPPRTVAQLEAAIFEERSPGEETVGSTFNSCTQGQLRLTQGNSRVVDPVVLPCSGVVQSTNTYWNVSSCPFAHFMAWADEADSVGALSCKPSASGSNCCACNGRVPSWGL